MSEQERLYSHPLIRSMDAHSSLHLAGVEAGSGTQCRWQGPTTEPSPAASRCTSAGTWTLQCDAKAGGVGVLTACPMARPKGLSSFVVLVTAQPVDVN